MIKKCIKQQQTEDKYQKTQMVLSLYFLLLSVKMYKHKLPISCDYGLLWFFCIAYFAKILIILGTLGFTYSISQNNYCDLTKNLLK